MSPAFAALGGPLATLLGLGYVAAVDPNVPGHYPTCPFRTLTGLSCPGCGTLRAMHALANGHLGAAAGLNVLAVAALPVLGWLWWRPVRARWRGEPPPRPVPAPLIWGLCCLVVGFGVIRNLPVGAALAP